MILKYLYLLQQISVSKISSIFKLFGFVHLCFQIYSAVFICVFKYIRLFSFVFSNIFGCVHLCFQIYSAVFMCVVVFSNIFDCVHLCFQIYTNKIHYKSQINHRSRPFVCGRYYFLNDA